MEDKYLPPEELSDKSKELWMSVVPSRAESPERLEMIFQALIAKDIADECTRIIKKEGMTVITPNSGVAHAHSLIKVEKENRQLFLKVWTKLGFDEDPMEGGFYFEPFEIKKPKKDDELMGKL